MRITTLGNVLNLVPRHGVETVGSSRARSEVETVVFEGATSHRSLVTDPGRLGRYLLVGM
jgi:hypothetical protein